MNYLQSGNIENDIELVVKKIENNVRKYDGKFPSAASTNKVYRKVDNKDWTEGFFVGQLWLTYELCGSQYLYEQAIRYTDLMIERIDQNIFLNHHDLGFLFSLSLYPAYMKTNNIKYLNYMKKVGDILISRFHEKGNFIQSWGELTDFSEYRAIIDSLMNLPLLFKISELTNDMKYSCIAKKHFKTVLENHIRKNNTTFHTYYFDPTTGLPTRGETAQGNRAESTWARGQAWGITGLAFNKDYINSSSIDGKIKDLLSVFIENMPSDGVAYWDFDFNDDNPSYKDSSSNAIVLCGLLENDRNKYKLEIERMYSDLREYVSRDLDEEIILDHSVYALPQKNGVDEGCMWGDYFYIESLVRIKNENWKKYW